MYVWTGTHAYRDHANGRVVEPGEQLPGDIADQVAASHPQDVEKRETESDDEDGDDEAVDDEAEWSEEAWLAGDYEERAEAVRDGRVDQHLDDIEDVERSETVTEAVEQRREDLSE